jgi:hypothetical protein
MELSALAPGTRLTVVRVPGGYEAATYNERCDISFWKLTVGPWMEVGHSTCPVLPGSGDSSGVNIVGVLLDHMSDATFIARGYFTGDGSGNYIAFTNGPHGWGTIAPGPHNTLVPTGDRSTDNGTPGIHWDVTVHDGLLVTSDDNVFFDTADGGEFPLTFDWKWSGTFFTEVNDTIVTAHIVNPPSPATDLPDTCPMPPPDGTYQGYLEGDPAGEGPGWPAADGRVHFFFGSTPDTGDGSACTLAVEPKFSMTVQATTESGASVWVTAPLWLLLAQTPLSGSAGVTLYPQETAPGGSPYYVPTRLGLTAITSNFGIADYPDITQDIGLAPTPTFGQVTINHGVPTAVALLPAPSE